MMSGLRLSKCSASKPVMSETVVNTWARCVAARSMQYLWYICRLPASSSTLNCKRNCHIRIFPRMHRTDILAIYLIDIVVKISLPRAEVSTQQSGVGSEHCGHVYIFCSQGDHPDTRLPFVTVHDHPRRGGWVSFGCLPVLLRCWRTSSSYWVSQKVRFDFLRSQGWLYLLRATKTNRRAGNRRYLCNATDNLILTTNQTQLFDSPWHAQTHTNRG